MMAALTGCTDGQTYPASYQPKNITAYPTRSEALLGATDTSIYAQQHDDEALSPEEMHAAAKKRVNPDHTRGRLDYTSRPKREDIATASQFRELKAPPQLSILKEDPSPALANIETSSGQETVQTQSFASRHIASSFSSIKRTLETLNTAPLSAPKADPTVSHVMNMRLGDYADKTRLVLDLNAAAQFKYEIKDSQLASSVLLVSLEGADWSFDTERYFKDHPLIESYQALDSGRGHVALRIILKQPSRILLSGAVRPDDHSGHRIFFDVAAL